jgi:anthranilate synthase/indole-3-glycerol phosphate synthase/phosphoribosylanthranilate isomerase
MAEIKRASPSKGAIALNANAAQQALTYALAGASVISVLTEPTWFKGSLLDMRLVRQAIDNLPNRPAVLRKDFILDEYQVAEARLYGADTVLLIVAMLPPDRLKSLYSYSVSLGMEPLVEVNNAQEMQTALEVGAKLIGVNNRNLHNFNVDMGTTSRLVDMVKGTEVVLCALSGITTPQDVRQYVQQGVGAVLVGEALMRAKDTRAFIHELLDWEDVPALQADSTPLVKICGIRTEEEAVVAAEAGASMIGLMFVPTSKRVVSIAQARKIAAAVCAIRAADPSADSLQQNGDTTTPEPWFLMHSRRLSRVITQGSSRPLLVGVFQNQPLSYIQDVVSAVQLDIVQLHGNENAELARHIPVPVIKVFHVDKNGRGLENITRPGLHEFILLDSAKPGGGAGGGTGVAFDWDLACDVADLGELTVETSSSVASGVGPVHNAQQATIGVQVNPETLTHRPPARLPLVLAGGLTPGNVADAVRKVHPWAVDVSGGVEYEGGGGKDPEKVREFIAAVKRAV